MQIQLDSYGNPYDASTGFPISLYFDENGNAFNAATGDWIDISHDVRDTLIGIFGRQGYPPYAYPGGNPNLSYPGYTPGASVNAGVRPGGVGGSLNISKETLMLIAGGFLIFMLGQRRR